MSRIRNENSYALTEKEMNRNMHYTTKLNAQYLCLAKKFPSASATASTDSNEACEIISWQFRFLA